MNEKNTLDISWETILKIFISLFCFYFLYLTRDILMGFFFALIISILFEPVISFLRRLKIPRILAVVLVYIGTFVLLSLLIYYSSAIFISEIRQFSKVFPQYFEKISPPLRGLGIKAFENIEKFLETLEKVLEKMAENIFNTLFVFFGGVFTTVSVITLALFLSLEENLIPRILALIVPKEYEDYAFSLFERCQEKVSGWFLARIISCIFVGLASYLVFLLFGVNYPFTLALLAGALEFIPIIGPILLGTIVFLLVSLVSIPRAVFILSLFILIQQIEINIITPILTRRFIGVSPILVLLALAIGGKLWGFLGAILSVPLIGILSEFLKEFLKKRKEEF